MCCGAALWQGRLWSSFEVWFGSVLVLVKPPSMTGANLEILVSYLGVFCCGGFGFLVVLGGFFVL